jgi:hypothetical protein
MEYEELYKVGMDTYHLVSFNEIGSLIEKHPYALAYERNQVEAFVEDYIKAKAEIDFDMSVSSPSISISHFNDSDLISLIEVSFQNPDKKSGVKIDLILNKAGVIYVEGVYAYFEPNEA